MLKGNFYRNEIKICKGKNSNVEDNPMRCENLEYKKNLSGIWDLNKIESAKNVCTRNYMEIPTYKGHYSKRTELCRLNIAKCHQHLMCFVVSWSIQSCAGPFSILSSSPYYRGTTRKNHIPG